MKTLKAQWAGACEKCEHESATVQTEKGHDDWFYDGDKVTCGHAGVIEAGGECAWCIWDEID